MAEINSLDKSIHDDGANQMPLPSSESVAPHRNSQEKQVDEIANPPLKDLATDYTSSLPSLNGRINEYRPSFETTQISDFKENNSEIIYAIENISDQVLKVKQQGIKELDTILHEAVLYGDVEAIRKQLSTRTIDPDKLQGLIEEAIVNGHPEIIRSLLSDERVLTRGQLGDVVKIAAENDQVLAIRELLSDGRTLTKSKMDIAVEYAADKGHVNAIRELLSNGRKLSENGLYTALKAAIENGHADAIQELLSGERQLELEERELINLVETAIKHNQLAACQILLSDGRTLTEDQLGQAVEAAAIHGDDNDIAILRFLLSDRRVTEGQLASALIYAAMGDSVEAIRELLSGGRTVTEEQMVKAVKWAVERGYVAAIQELLSSGRTISQTHLNELASLTLTRYFPSSDLRIAVLSELISKGGVFSESDRERAVLLAAREGNLEFLEMLLRQGAIRATVRDSALTQARQENREYIHAMLNAAQVVIPSSSSTTRNESSRQPNSTDVTLSELQENPQKYLSMICEKGIPDSVFLTDHPEAIDLGGIKKQLISSLSGALNPHLHLNGEMPFWEQEDKGSLMTQMGKYFSLLYKENKTRTDKLLTGEMVNPLFFDLVKLVERADIPEEQMLKDVAQLLRPHVPDYVFCFDYILNPTPAHAKKYAQVNETIYLGVLDSDPLKGGREIIHSFLYPAQEFAKGMTEEFKKELLSQDSQTLSLSIQGQAVSSELLLNALVIKNDEAALLKKVDWLKEKIQSSNKEWQINFLKAVTGKTSLSAGMAIEVKNSWREGYAFECHTCFNSIDLPKKEMEKEAFFSALDFAIGVEGYNIA